MNIRRKWSSSWYLLRRSQSWLCLKSRNSKINKSKNWRKKYKNWKTNKIATRLSFTIKSAGTDRWKKLSSLSARSWKNIRKSWLKHVKESSSSKRKSSWKTVWSNSATTSSPSMNIILVVYRRRNTCCPSVQHKLESNLNPSSF